MTLSPPAVPVARPRRVGHGRSVIVHLSAPDGEGPDLDGLARAVERLVRSIAPEVETRVTPADAAPGGAPPAAGAEPEEEGGFALDRDRRTVRSDGREVPLTRREFDLVAYLHLRRGRALGRRELMTQVWGTGYLAGDRTVDVHVRRLRVKLGRHGARIRTLRGYGYRFD